MLSIQLSALAQTPPHLSQAWIAESTGDGLPGKTGKESYIYEGCKAPSATCMNGHVWNYGADTCIKYEVDAGVHSEYTGTYYVNCDSVDCCRGGDVPHERPDVKKWDIGQAGKALGDTVKFLGSVATTELGGKVVTADAWNEVFHVPFAKNVHVNYTYYVTTSGNDTVTHRIDYSAPGSGAQAGSILYGDFQVQHDLDSFRQVFQAPAECLKPNTLKCSTAKTKEWDQKYGFGLGAASPEVVVEQA